MDNCGNCKWHNNEDTRVLDLRQYAWCPQGSFMIRQFRCENKDSDYDYTQNSDICGKWESEE